MKRLVTYVAIFMLGFVAFVVAFAPAATVWQFARSDVSRQLPDLQVLAVDGTIWSGSANVRYWNFPPTDVHWTIMPMSLLHGRLDIRTIASGNAIHIETSGSIAPGHLDAVSAGYVESAWINPFSTNYGLKFSGRLNIDKLHLVSDFQWFSAADGNLHWTGGPVVYRTARGPQHIELPALDGTLKESGQDLHLDIARHALTLIAIGLKRTGWVKVDIKARLFEVAKLPWPAGEAQGDTALTLEEQLFPTR